MFANSSLYELVLVIAILALVVLTGEIFLGLIVLLLLRILSVVVDIRRTVRMQVEVTSSD